ncbi:MAG: glycosyltransferase [Candidatus Thiodiazotropha taylori]
MANILVTCFGSFGDLYPYIALSKSLQQRGHVVKIGSALIYQSVIESEGILFTHVRTAFDKYSTPDATREFIERIFDPVKGGKLLTLEIMMFIEDMYKDTITAIEHIDFVISNPLAYTTPIVCRDKEIPWISTVLAPMFFLSVYDPPILAAAPWLRKIHSLSPTLYRTLFKLIASTTKTWVKPLYQLCDHYKITPPYGNPLFKGQYSPYGTLAMFPDYFAEPQIDWPENTKMVGFPLFASEVATSEEQTNLQKFIQTGEAPIVFALGSAAVNAAGEFYRISAKIVRRLKRRAIMVYGAHDEVISEIKPGNDIFFIRYIAYNKVFPKALNIL